MPAPAALISFKNIFFKTNPSSSFVPFIAINRSATDNGQQCHPFAPVLWYSVPPPASVGTPVVVLAATVEPSSTPLVAGDAAPLLVVAAVDVDVDVDVVAPIIVFCCRRRSFLPFQRNLSAPPLHASTTIPAVSERAAVFCIPAVAAFPPPSLTMVPSAFINQLLTILAISRLY